MDWKDRKTDTQLWWRGKVLNHDGFTLSVLPFLPMVYEKTSTDFVQ